MKNNCLKWMFFLFTSAAPIMVRAELIEFDFLETTPALYWQPANKLFTDTEHPGVAAAGSVWGGYSTAGMGYIGTPEAPNCLVGVISFFQTYGNYTFSQGSPDEPQEVGHVFESKGGHYNRVFGQWVRIPAAALWGMKYQIPAAEYDALVDMYHKAEGFWPNYGWNDPAASAWAGVTVTGFQYDWRTGQILSTGTVTQLQLGEWTGPIPDSIGSLVNLQTLSVYGTGLLGPIPASIGSLVNLQTLSVYGTGLLGPIPASIGSLVNLQSLYLAGDQLAGPIPDTIGNLVNLTSLTIPYSRISGSIPSSIGNLLNLRALVIGDYGGNELTGPIPESLGNLVNLEQLWLRWNQLSGSIPASLGNLTHLRELDLTGNRLSGNIPATLGNLNNLEELHLEGNQLIGGIPDELGNLGNLRTLDLAPNQLSGGIPNSLAGLAQLRHLILGNRWTEGAANHLGGSIPDGLCQLSDLVELNLARTELSGLIPPCLGDLLNLRALDLSWNQLNGSLPASFGNFTDMQQIDLDHNRLSGPLPGFSLHDYNAEVNISYNCFDISPGSQVRQVLHDLGLQYHYGTRTIAFGPQNLGCGPVAFGDLNNDGCVNRDDLTLLLAEIQARSRDLTYDLNGDGKVDIADARFLVLHFTNQDGSPCTQ